MDPLSTSGSQRNGGRYNDPGGGVVYTSFDRATAVAEVVRGLRVRGIDPKNFGPEDWWVYQIRVSVSSVVDLRDGATMSDLAITPEVLLADNTTETRRIGKYARDNGFQAVRAPSAAANDKDNLVLFIDRLPTRPEVVSSTPVDLSPGT